MHGPTGVGGSDLKAEYRTTYIWTISLVAAMGGLLFGYDWVVIGGAKPFFVRYFELTDPGVIGWAMSCALVGCMLGALVTGVLSDKFGRKRLLIGSAVLFAVTSLGNGLAWNFQVFLVWRILGGLAIGLASALSPMYIAEIAPPKMRGKLVAVNQLTIVIGILLAQVVNWLLVLNLPKDAGDEYIRQSWYGQMGWRWMFGLTAVPSGLFFLGMLFVPESPRWLAKNGKPDRAKNVLEALGGAGYASASLEEIQATLVNEMEKVNFRELWEPKMLKILVMGVILAILQQWCGINTIFNYAEDIFADAGYPIKHIMTLIVITGSVNFLFTLVAMATVDRLGRRPLMLFGQLGLAILFVATGACYFFHSPGEYVVVLILSAIGCYAMTLAPVIWVVIAEIFPNRIRGAAMSVAVMALWIACFILTYTLPLMKDNLGFANTFWIYAAICLLGFLFVLFRLPETKGKSLEEIEKALIGDRETSKN